MSKLPLISESPGVDISAFGYYSGVVVSCGQIYHFLTDEGLKHNWFACIATTSSKLSVGVVAPDVDSPFLIESEGVVDAGCHLGDGRQVELNWIIGSLGLRAIHPLHSQIPNHKHPSLSVSEGDVVVGA